MQHKRAWRQETLTHKDKRQALADWGDSMAKLGTSSYQRVQAGGCRDATSRCGYQQESCIKSSFGSRSQVSAYRCLLHPEAIRTSLCSLVCALLLRFHDGRSRRGPNNPARSTSRLTRCERITWVDRTTATAGTMVLGEPVGPRPDRLPTRTPRSMVVG